MKVVETGFEGLFVLEPRVFADERGYFFESFNSQTFKNNGLDFEWVQDNQSQSKYGVVRGLHFQKPPYAQTKLIRVLKGEILDVVVDLRHDMPTYGKSFSIVLSSQNHLQLLIPKGFAHGFSVLSEEADVMYKCDALYNKESESGILFNDPKLGIDWQVEQDKMVVSDKDLVLPAFDAQHILF
ncbi:MAG: dTDP-4-dehydrorhamnose 3,5-epimerase [Bacteroidota bacterium]|jgi:dTDP-4-dehydrorhamnose 3,5-epimerase